MNGPYGPGPKVEAKITKKLGETLNVNYFIVSDPHLGLVPK